MAVHRVVIVGVVVAVFGLASTAGAALIGPGMSIGDAGDVDTPGQNRLNVDRSAFINLGPGTYNVNDFGLRVNTHAAPGTIAAMLLSGAPSTYTTLWVSPDFDPIANGVQTVSYTAGTQQFTLAAATTVYGGVFTKNNGAAIIGLDANNSDAGNSSSTDHDTAYTAPTGAGQSVTGISNPNLGRTYAFEINVTPTVLSTGGLIGPGAATAGGSADGGGGRTNVEQDFLTLTAGTYDVEDFEFHAVNTNGTVQPFLAERTTPGANHRHTPLWVGSAVTPSATGTNTDTYVLGSEQFTLAATTDVYAGFVMTDNAVGFSGGGVTDHQGSALSPAVGVELVTFSHKNLGRSYSFGVNVALVPEPSTLLLSALGLLGLFARGRRG